MYIDTYIVLNCSTDSLKKHFIQTGFFWHVNVIDFFVSPLNHHINKITIKYTLFTLADYKYVSHYNVLVDILTYLYLDRFFPTKSINHEAMINFYGVIKFYGQAIACPSIRLFKTLSIFVLTRKNCTFVGFEANTSHLILCSQSKYKEKKRSNTKMTSDQIYILYSPIFVTQCATSFLSLYQ